MTKPETVAGVQTHTILSNELKSDILNNRISFVQATIKYIRKIKGRLCFKNMVCLFCVQQLLLRIEVMDSN